MTELGDYLRSRRSELGLSQEGMADRFALLNAPTVTKHEIGRYERGLRTPGRRLLEIYATALDVPLPMLERLKSGIEIPDSSPTNIGTEGSLIDRFMKVLMTQRRDEDIYGPGPIYKSVKAQRDLIDSLVKDARPSSRDELLKVLSSHDQFLGWMAVDLGQFDLASQHYKNAGEIARALEDADMTTSILSMRSQLAWLAGDPQLALDLANGNRDDASPSVNALMEQQRARAYAMQGDFRRTDYHLIRAEKIMEDAGSEPEWTYFFNGPRLEIQRGIAYLTMGKYRQAAKLLAAAERLPETYRRDRARYRSMRATALARSGQIEEAKKVLNDARGLGVDSYLVNREMSRASESID